MTTSDSNNTLTRTRGDAHGFQGTNHFARFALEHTNQLSCTIRDKGPFQWKFLTNEHRSQCEHPSVSSQLPCMSSDDELDFSCGDAMADLGHPIRIGEVKRGDVVLIQNHPCKVACLDLRCGLLFCVVTVVVDSSLDREHEPGKNRKTWPFQSESDGTRHFHGKQVHWLLADVSQRLHA